MTQLLVNGPDEAVRRFCRLREKQQSPTQCNPFLIEGLVAADKCNICGHNRRHEVPAKRGGGWRDRCRRCGAVWPFHDECFLPNWGHVSGRPEGFDARLVDLADLRLAIEEVQEDDWRLYELYVSTDLGYEAVAELATELALDDPQGWVMPIGGFTLNRVRGAVKRARRILEKSLAARGLMPHRLPVFMLDGNREIVDVLEPIPADVVVPGDPVTWSGLLQDFAISLEALRGGFLVSAVTRLSRGSSAEFGTIYREIPLWMNGS